MKSLVLLLAGLMLLAPTAGCLAPDSEDEEEPEPEFTPPWFCNSSGTGGHHIDPVYENSTKGEFSQTDCSIVTLQFAAALEWAMQWPNISAAEADGWHMAVDYVEGMGTHHVRLNDFWMDGNQDFDREDPEFPGTRMDRVFEYDKPEFLMYAGTDPDSELVGFAWYVKSDPQNPPYGFAGDNDWWHRHESLCFNNASFLTMGEDIDDETCDQRQGTNVILGDFWMVHAWILEPWLQQYDVFANHHPCLSEDGPIHDEAEQCWMDAMHGPEDGGHAGHDGHGDSGEDSSDDGSDNGSDGGSDDSGGHDGHGDSGEDSSGDGSESEDDDSVGSDEHNH